MNTILGLLITAGAAVGTASCLIGSIACMAAAQRKYYDRERGCKVVVFPAGEDSPIVEDPTYATDYETGKFTLIQDDEAFSDESDDYDGGLNLR